MLIIGTPSLREYSRRDGSPGFSLDVAVNKFSFAGGKKQDGGGSTSYGGAELDPLGDLDDHPF